MRMPPVSQCLYLKDELGNFRTIVNYTFNFTTLPPFLSLSLSPLLPHSLSLSEHTFEDLIENQPIGMRLFHEFCQKDLLLSRCVVFLQALDELELMVDEKYAASARKTFEEYISTRVRPA